jgi:hypothetical protein
MSVLLHFVRLCRCAFTTFGTVAIAALPSVTWAHGGGESEALKPWTSWPFVPELLIGVDLDNESKRIDIKLVKS